MVRFLVMCSDIAVFARSKRFSQNGSFCENSLLLVLYTVCPSGRAAIRAGGKKYMNIGLHGGTKNRRGKVVAFCVQRLSLWDFLKFGVHRSNEINDS